MHTFAKVFLGAATLAAVGVIAHAQGVNAGASVPSMTDVTVNDPPGPIPDPGTIAFVPPAGLKWEGNPQGMQHVVLFGDPSKPGLYGVLGKWNPGAWSRPHISDQDRFIYVISGAWWVSSSPHFDPKLTYPMTAGTFLKQVANTVRWDGARAGGPPAIFEIVGMGPVKTVPADENGKPVPPH